MTIVSDTVLALCLLIKQAWHVIVTAEAVDFTRKSSVALQRDSLGCKSHSHADSEAYDRVDLLQTQFVSPSAQDHFHVIPRERV